MISAKQNKVKAIALAAAAALCIGVVACAVYFEVNARQRAYHELVGLRGRTETLLDAHRISGPEAALLESRLDRARRDLSGDDVRGAQTLIDGVRTYLQVHARAA